MITDIQLGWLAGILDGEGSIGIYRRRATSTGTLAYFPCVQMATTTAITASEVVRLMQLVGVTGSSYRYQEKKPEKHRPSYHVRTVRLGDVAALCNLVGPHSIEKRGQWVTVGAFCASRLEGRTLRPDGRVIQTGRRIPFRDSEVALWLKARELNQRGPNHG